MTDIHDHIRQLTRPHTHNERYEHNTNGTTWTSQHTTLVPALIDQLTHAQPASNRADTRGGFGSRPAARIEALDTLTLIDNEAARWVRKLGEDDPGFTKACISKLGGLYASATAEQQTTIGRDVRRWWNQARIVTGWDSPAWKPDNTCPMCEKRGSLRIKLLHEVAMCSNCRETWDEGTIFLLAAHIREENSDPDENDPIHDLTSDCQ